MLCYLQAVIRSKSVLAYSGGAELLGLRGTRTYRRGADHPSMLERLAGRRGEAATEGRVAQVEGPQASGLQDAKAQGVVVVSDLFELGALGLQEVKLEGTGFVLKKKRTESLCGTARQETDRFCGGENPLTRDSHPSEISKEALTKQLLALEVESGS